MDQSHLTEDQVELLPSEEDVEFYQQNGYYISRKIIPSPLLDAAIDGSELLYQGNIENLLPMEVSECWKPEDGVKVLRKNDFSCLQRHEFADIVNFPLLGAIAARLTGEPIRLWHDQLLYKPMDDPETLANVGWHTDRQYWQCCTSKEMLTAWVPFRDVGIKEGSITFIESSNHWSDDISSLNFREQDLEKLACQFGSEKLSAKTVTAQLQRGQVTFHHCMTIHGSGPNNSRLPRQALAVHMQPGSNRWCPYDYKMPDGGIKHHDVEALVRKQNGNPDYTDPAICPAL